jgi:hypothetical protein
LGTDLLIKDYLLFRSNCQEKFTIFWRDRDNIISDPSLGRGQGRRIRAFWGPMGARYASTGRMRRPGCDRAFSSQVVTLGGSENATRRAEAFSSQVVTLGGSENAIKQTVIFKPSGYTWRFRKNVQNSV